METASAGEPVLLDFPGSAAVDDAVDAARREHEDAVAAFGRAARTVSTLDARVTSGRGGTDDTARLYGAWQDLSTAQRRLDAALDRLRDLGDCRHAVALQERHGLSRRADRCRRQRRRVEDVGDRRRRLEVPRGGCGRRSWGRRRRRGRRRTGVTRRRSPTRPEDGCDADTRKSFDGHSAPPMQRLG